jgi:hypothetical protein
MECASEVDKHSEFVENVTGQLMKSFLTPLKQYRTDTTFFTHVGILSEILEWSLEFSAFYYHRLSNWQKFRQSEANVFNADTLEEFVTGFGHLKFMIFCLDHSEEKEWTVIK